MFSRIALAAAAVLFGAGAALASEAPGEAEALAVQEEVTVQEAVSVNNEQSSQQNISSDSEGQANTAPSGEPQTAESSSAEPGQPAQPVSYSSPSKDTSPPAPVGAEANPVASTTPGVKKSSTPMEYYFAAAATTDVYNPPVLTNDYPASQPMPTPTQPLEGFLYQLQQLLGSAFTSVTMLPEFGFSGGAPFQPELTLLLIVITAFVAINRYVESLKRSGFVGAPRSDMLPLTSITPLKWVLSGRYAT